MKKFVLIIIIIIIIILIGVICLNKNENVENVQYNEENIIEEIPQYIDDNFVTVGLYNDSNGKRMLAKEYESKWIKKKDIETFMTMFTNEAEISKGYLQNVFFEYYNKYENPQQYHIGYNIKFTINDDKVLEQTILTPKDTEVLYDYLETYLYNGPQKKIGQWYSHVTEEEYTEETILASIKLTAGSLINEITSDIELTVFTYNGEDDFDEDGKYRGNSKYTINVKNKK